MTRFARTAICVLIWILPSFVARAEETVAGTEGRLSAAVKYLASDELEGRGVDTEGINKAADFIAEEFKKLGLKTDLFDGSPFQKFGITVKSELGPKENNKL